MRWIMMVCLVLSGVSCKYKEVEREIGYKGRARVNPWLAAEKFCGRYGYEVTSSHSWTKPDWDDAAWFMPAAVIGNVSFARQMEDWVQNGGHLILLVEHAASEGNDWNSWSTTVSLEPPLLEWFERAGIEFREEKEDRIRFGKSLEEDRIRFGERDFTVEASSTSSVALDGGEPGVFVTKDYGSGRLTILTDARIFRNRWIDDYEHASLLLELVRYNEYGTNVGFMRGRGLSFWRLLGEYLWPVLIALGVWLFFWLWRNFSRFGPIESAEISSELRGYDYHLAALGDFQWRLDRAAGLLVPLRAQVMERGQRANVRMGRREDDFYQFLADQAGISRERAFRALSENVPPDSSVLTHITADLQKLLKALN